MEQFFTWNTLGTFAGYTALTCLLTQCLKNIWKKLPTQWLSFLISLVLLTAAAAFTSGFAPSHLAQLPIASILVSFSSNGAFAATKRILESSLLSSSRGAETMDETKPSDKPGTDRTE